MCKKDRHPKQPILLDIKRGCTIISFIKNKEKDNSRINNRPDKTKCHDFQKNYFFQIYVGTFQDFQEPWASCFYEVKADIGDSRINKSPYRN